MRPTDISTNIWAVSLEDGREYPVTDFSGRHGGLDWFSLATDGDYLYFTTGKRISATSGSWTQASDRPHPFSYTGLPPSRTSVIRRTTTGISSFESIHALNSKPVTGSGPLRVTMDGEPESN